MQPTWQWQVHQPQSPLETASARRTAHGIAEAAEGEASAAPVTTAGPQQRLASLVLEPLPDARSDGSYSSTTFAPDHRFGRSGSFHSQALDTEEAEVEEAAPASSAGQANLSATTVTKVLPQPAQKPPASNLAGQAGESPQASLATEAQAATPTLDEKVAAARAKAEASSRTVTFLEERVAIEKKLPLEAARKEAGLVMLAKQIELHSQRRDRELQEISKLEAEAGAAKQQYAG